MLYEDIFRAFNENIRYQGGHPSFDLNSGVQEKETRWNLKISMSMPISKSLSGTA
jgi:hypothetical protein